MSFDLRNRRQMKKWSKSGRSQMSEGWGAVTMSEVAERLWRGLAPIEARLEDTSRDVLPSHV
jgi:hypothetical protein